MFICIQIFRYIELKSDEVIDKLIENNIIVVLRVKGIFWFPATLGYAPGEVYFTVK